MTRSDTYPGALDRRPSGSWRWRVSIAGERITKTWDDDLTEEEAARKARKRYDELAAQVARGDGTDVRLSRLLAIYRDQKLPGLAESTRTAYNITFRALSLYYGEDEDPRLEAISRGDIKGFISWRRVHGPDGSERAKPLSGWSLQRSLGALSAHFSEAVEREWIQASPTRRVSVDVPDREPVILSRQEYEKLLEAGEARRCSGHSSCWPARRGSGVRRRSASGGRMWTSPRACSRSYTAGTGARRRGSSPGRCP